MYAARMSRLSSESAFFVLAKAKALEAEGRDIVHLEIGEPDFNTPQNVKEAAIRAIRDGYTHYTPAAGIPAARKAIADYVSRTRGVAFAPNEVVITPGAKPILFYAILALIEAGDEVILPNPGFPTYESMVRFAGGKPVPISLREELGFRLDTKELETLLGPRTKLIILNSPHNPTGGALSEDDLAAIAEMALDRKILILSDEIYSRIVYEGDHHSVVSLQGMKDQVILLDGFSKAFAMTGWRLGFGVMNASLAEKITLLMINSNSCTAAFTQMAGIEALEGPQDAVAMMVAELNLRRSFIVQGLNQIPGVTCCRPQGAFYAFPNIKSFGIPSRVLAERILMEGGVAVLAGSDFGSAGEGYLRISYANSLENLEVALRRIRDVLTGIA
ncbi:MAG: pyridoxal phosphate-dependent aminotransferase [Coprothermobacterota bacterium]|nr:pyridoxal phosphate-dependent aminotransferase [Coprothermobacterota bacterium]